MSSDDEPSSPSYPSGSSGSGGGGSESTSPPRDASKPPTVSEGDASASGPASIGCGSERCTPGVEVCIERAGSSSCTASPPAQYDTRLDCDDTADCPAQFLCCVGIEAASQVRSSCERVCDTRDVVINGVPRPVQTVEMCDPLNTYRQCEGTGGAQRCIQRVGDPFALCE